MSGVWGGGWGDDRDLPRGESSQRTLLRLLSKGQEELGVLRTALGEGNTFSELHLCLSWLSHHPPLVLLQKELDIRGLL